tara:strand:- start:32 stop:1825 length:1794 start_codon:yes stop_codon:yes gene_type:complete
MPNLNNIFNNFFPQSQTGKKGIFLLRMAWTIEIAVAIIGFTIGLIIMKGTQTEQGTSQLVSGFSFLGSMTLNDFSIGLIFMIVAIVELTKIPLATAVYYSARLSWRIVFIIGLLLVNVSTFETIVTGFERINRERTKVVSNYITEYHSILTEIENLSIDERADEIDEDISKELATRREIQSQIDENNLSAEKQIKQLRESSGNKEVIDQLQRRIDSLGKEIEELTKANTQLRSDSKGAWVKSTFNKQIEANNKIIDRKTQEQTTKQNQIDSMLRSSNQNNAASIELIRKTAANANKKLNSELEEVATRLKQLNDRKIKKSENESQKDEKINQLEEKRDENIRKIDELAPDNQVFRVATWLRDWFEINYDEEIRKVEKRIIEFENLKVIEIQEPNWLQKIFPFFYDNKKIDNTILDKQITSAEKQIKILKRKSDLKASTIQTSPYADIPRGALVAAFWLWFGVLSFVISVVGTLLAFASLVLLDPRLHKIRNKRANWRGAAERFSKLFFTMRRYIHGRIKRFKDPIIKEVKVEVEVEKIVKEPVYVYKDKIVHVEKEVPVKEEIIKKEIVYVPLPTDDEELLKKGPFIAPGDDKDRKK